MASTVAVPAADKVTKHRACDECRSRKLACSKEPDGCARCKKEGITCYYSPQKQMGRPRKRRYVDTEEEDVTAAVTASQPQPQEQSLPFLQPADDISYPQLQDTLPGGDFLDTLNFLDDPVSADINTWDLLPNYNDALPFDPQIFDNDGSFMENNSALPALNLSGVDLLGTINFGDTDLSQDTVSKDLSHTLHRYLTDQIEPPNAESHQASDSSTPPDSSDNGASVNSPGDTASSPNPSMRSVPTVSCSCLATLFFALESLGNLPNEVIPAMKVARNASKVAHDVIKCTICLDCMLDEPLKPPPIQAFQNLMLLGTLVPSACNAYARILEMVDEETARAKKEGRTFWFAFKDIGGLWGCVGETSDSCTVYQTYNNKTMPPDLWRLTIRGLLRLDVYGLNEKDHEIPGAASYRQLGLKDVVDTLEERSRQRHALLDSRTAAGHNHDHIAGVIYPSKPVAPSERNCTRVLETARIALENLVIA
ncbi:hypothetical protein NW752_011831 [Fusarium irregulare]|uniref:Zn(2)-C6 fungal-type domain-containing protein n=1 Tax=Fusarium irregulare TaxID=2494466 RepID=A0A9W8PDQ8_9HYPO|nr:hypothetical protein NW766_012311 [Fusarium irregulare]KAJ4004217.1 hypothetical protein NW752_011831 [Fusarium irregulare]